MSSTKQAYPQTYTEPNAYLLQACLGQDRETIQTNLFGVMHTCRVCLPQMIERRSGKIIILIGGGALTARPNFSAYAASKAGAVRFAETLAEEIREHNIQVNCMSPGGTYTNMTDEILRAGERAGWKEEEDALQVRQTGGVAPEKQIQLALFLASEESNHISGKVIQVMNNAARAGPKCITSFSR